MRKVIKIGFIGVFCAVIGLAFPIFNIFSKQLSMDSHENRLMTGLPIPPHHRHRCVALQVGCSRSVRFCSFTMG